MVDVFETVEIGGDRVTVLRQEEGEKTRTATIVLRGATEPAAWHRRPGRDVANRI
jgi:hypothetical protein